MTVGKVTQGLCTFPSPYATIIISKQTKTTMKKATARPTAATLQAAQAKADRRAAALARRQDDYRQDAGFTAIYTQAVGN